jgi:hypothetical protein
MRKRRKERKKEGIKRRREYKTKGRRKCQTY